MIWRTVEPQKKGWIGPHRVIIQDAEDTIWTTVGGRLYRSAPENAQWPEDLTQIQQQIDRMVKNPGAMQTSPEHPFPWTSPALDSSPNHHPSSEHGNFSRLQSQTSESAIQPDQEPDTETRRETTSEESPQPQHPGESSNDERLFFVCQEEVCALAEDDGHHFAWRCEFDVNVLPGINSLKLDQDALLATQAKKQRSAVKLTELSSSERKEFDAAKQTEVATGSRQKP